VCHGCYFHTTLPIDSGCVVGVSHADASRPKWLGEGRGESLPPYLATLGLVDASGDCNVLTNQGKCSICPRPLSKRTIKIPPCTSMPAPSQHHRTRQSSIRILRPGGSNPLRGSAFPVLSPPSAAHPRTVAMSVSRLDSPRGVGSCSCSPIDAQDYGQFTLGRGLTWIPREGFPNQGFA